jgi:hypothetical protein
MKHLILIASALASGCVSPGEVAANPDAAAALGAAVESAGDAALGAAAGSPAAWYQLGGSLIAMGAAYMKLKRDSSAQAERTAARVHRERDEARIRRDEPVDIKLAPDPSDILDASNGTE